VSDSTYHSSNRRSLGIPAGLRLRCTLQGHLSWISTIAWAPNMSTLASASDDNTINIWHTDSGDLAHTLEGHEDTVFGIAWSPSGQMLASGSDDESIICWHVGTGEAIARLTGHKSGVVTVTWLPDDDTLVSGSGDRTIRFWSVRESKVIADIQAHNAWIRQLAVSPNYKVLASASFDKTVKLWELASRQCIGTLEGHSNGVHSVAWSPGGSALASSSKDMTVRIWDPQTGRLTQVLEGHTAAVYSVSYSRDGNLLASKSVDGTVRLWRTNDWRTIAILPEDSKITSFGSLSFHSTRDMLATLGQMDTVVRVWSYDKDLLEHATGDAPAVSYLSAKVALVGDSNVGKSCLALRLAEDRYEEQGTTHGMRFWELTPGQLDPGATVPDGCQGDVVIWDMGGQDQYRLIHQLFLHDTTLALILFDPTRGRSAFDEVEAWNRRLAKQLTGRTAVKLLVGTKLDEEGVTIDVAGIDRLMKNCGFSSFVQTSARTGRGLSELRALIAKAIDWTSLGKTTRPEVFQRIRADIETARGAGEVVLLVSDLERRLRDAGVIADANSLVAVVEQLAMQGLVADTQLATGERALVLHIFEVERYSGSLMLAATMNPRGIPMLEERFITSSQMIFPRIEAAQRLPWMQERVVLECVVELLLRHGIALRHEGLLIFPALFRATESVETFDSRYSIPLYYDFTGAIDNIYSALVASLAMSTRFGRYRLWECRAEFEVVDAGVCGLRTVPHPRGIAHLDLYFSPDVNPDLRDLFLVFVEDHLRSEGVEITENIEMTCACGVRLPEQAIRQRMAQGFGDIICPGCERRNQISAGAKQARETSGNLTTQLLALKTTIETKVARQTIMAKVGMNSMRPLGEPIRILHLSDLHMRPDSDSATMLEQLITDLRDEGGGLGFARLQYLLVSGDLSNRARPEEFEHAYRLISGIIETFGITPARCVIVPGNHDLNWDEPVYDWKPQRQVDAMTLVDGEYIKQGVGYLVRNKDRYPLRLRNFNERFYKFLTQEDYPLDFQEQCMPFIFPEAGIQILSVNSCWEIDEFFRRRASIYSRALTKGLEEARRQAERATSEGLLNEGASLLRIAVWHHPVTGNEKMQDDAFLDRLRVAGFRLCLHGHVHEDRSDVINYNRRNREMFVAGAGSFGAPVHDRPEATPRLYNVLEINPGRTEVKVHTRCMRRETGAWEGWAVWDSEQPGTRLTYYRIPLVGPS
jgi:small GTP-binding protein